jgi:glycosyltransferase involved in cell wall biosynthesis
VEKVWNFTSGIDESWLIENKIRTYSTVKFVFIGRNEVRKGIEELNHVINGMLGVYQFQFHFIGPIPKNERILNSQVVYHGELKSKKEICHVLDSMNVLVCPSHSEGMPNVILEGMARGLAIVATNVGAVEMLVDDTNGNLVEAINTAELEKALVECIEMDVSVLERKCEESKRKVSNDYLWGNLIQRVTERISSSIK